MTHIIKYYTKSTGTTVLSELPGNTLDDDHEQRWATGFGWNLPILLRQPWGAEVPVLKESSSRGGKVKRSRAKENQ